VEWAQVRTSLTPLDISERNGWGLPVVKFSPGVINSLFIETSEESR
jgi:hypothetical protein